MPPMRTGWIGYESVLEGPAGRYTTLTDSNGAVRRSCSVLEHAVEMEGGGLVAQLIIRIYDDSIADISFNRRGTC